MKKVLLLITLLFASVLAHAQNCNIDLTFNTQASIDNFSVDYSGCTDIDGTIVVNGSDITNLNGLSSLKIIHGGLNILNNPRLVSISGLSGITDVGTVINIEGNPLLSNLTGFDNISYIGTGLRVVYNATLTSIQALKNIRYVAGYLSIGGNLLLTNLSGLENIFIVKAGVSIGGNASLVDINGLSKLESIGTYLYIVDNPALSSLQGLMKLTSIGDYLTVSNNDALSSLSGLDNIELKKVNSEVTLKFSNSLSLCGVKSICQILRSGFLAYVEGNAAGCLSVSDILLSGSCTGILPVTLISFTGKNTTEGNLLSWQTTSETNNSGFSVERSVNGKFFEETGFVEGNGNVDNQTKDYSFIDKTPGEITYYRLKQIDFDQTFTYSKIIAVKSGELANSQKENTIVYPNPARGQLTIETKNRNREFRIQSIQGITLKEESVLPSKPIDTSFLQDGLYMISVGKEVFKVVVNN